MSEQDAGEAARWLIDCFKETKVEPTSQAGRSLTVARAYLSSSKRIEELENALGAPGALLTGEQLMDEMGAYVTGRGGNPAVAKAIRDAFEGRGRDPQDKGKLIHAVRNDLKVEAVTMYRRVEPKQIPAPRACLKATP